MRTTKHLQIQQWKTLILGTLVILLSMVICTSLSISQSKSDEPMTSSSKETENMGAANMPTKEFAAVPVNPPTAIASSTLEVAAPPVCVPSPIKLVAFEERAEVSKVYWSDDGQHLYFLKDDEWWEYSVESQDAFPLTDLKSVAPRTPPSFALDHLSSIKDWDTRYFFLSPSGKKAIYADSTLNSELLVATPESDSAVTTHEYGADIFLFQDGQYDPLYMGRTADGVNYPVWFPGEEKVLLEMFGTGESPLPSYPLYLLNIPEQSLIPFVNIEEVGLAKVKVLDISPDGNWVMYQTSPGDYVVLKNVNDFNIRPLYSIPRGYGARWLPDGERIVTVVDAGPGYYSVYLFDINADRLTRIISDLNGTGTIFFFFGISSNRVMLAYLDSVLSGPDELYVLDLCLGMDE